MNIKIIFPMLAAVCAGAQTTCPPINFLNAKTINLNPTASSHLVLLRQSDGSYTAFEMANAPTYGVLRTIPHFEQQFSNCVPRAKSGAARKAASPASPQGGVGEPAAYAVLDSGNYLFVSPDSGGLDVTVFDPHLQFVSENHIGALGAGFYLSIVLADVNGDGNLDVVAQYEANDLGEGGAIRVFLGNGSGGFQSAGGFPLTGTVNSAMAVGDLNGDGKPDIVVGAPGLFDPDQQSAGSIVLALGKGDGTFVPTVVPVPNEISPTAVAIADLNGDGKNDVVVLTCPLTEGQFCIPDEVVVMLGNGDGTFGPGAAFPVSNAAAAIAIGDVNGDGIPDIITNGVTILLGDGKGGFPTRKDFLSTVGDSVILADFDGDGDTDVLIGVGNPLILSSVLQNGSDALTVFFGDGNGNLAAAPQAPSPDPVTIRFPPSQLSGLVPDISMTTGDFNKDGITDLAYVSDFQFLSVFPGNASDTIAPVFTYDFTLADQQAYVTSVVAADFNQDGILDLAVTVAGPSPGSIMIFLGNGDGTFMAPTSISAPDYIWSLVKGDFNQDGHLDLAAVNGTGSSETTDEVVVFLGQGDGTFAPPQTYTAAVGAIVAGDFNGDGFDDIAIANSAGPNLLLGKGDGTFSPGATIPFPPGTGLQSLVTADVNGDGKLDLVAGIFDSGPVTGGVAILLGRGDGTFGAPTTYPTRPDFSGDIPLSIAVVVGDFNGDGISDVLVNDATLYVGNGDGTFEWQTTDLPATYGPLIAADFNGDGKLDVASGLISLGNTPLVPFFPFLRGLAVFFNLSHPTALLSVVSAADFSSGPLSPHSIASAFGKHLALSTASGAPPSLPTTLGGASVSVQDQSGTVSQAEIYYASPGQVNFVLPAGLEAGNAIVTIATTDGQSASAEIQIASNPKIFLVDPSGIPAGYVVQAGADNVQTMEPIFTEQGGHVQEVPIDVSTGEVYLILFGTGFDNPPSATGSFYTSSGNYVSFTPTYAGPQSQFPGLDQVNILLPSSLSGSGVSNLTLNFGNSQQNLYITIK